jgi:hypothetical protein
MAGRWRKLVSPAKAKMLRSIARALKGIATALEDWANDETKESE